MKVLELRGINSLYAAQAFHKVMLGLKMLPAYMLEGYEEFYERIDAMDPPDQEKMIREACAFVKLDRDEMSDVLRFAADANGVAVSEASIKNFKPEEIHEMLVAVFVAVAREHKISFITKDEKKKSKGSASTLEKHSSKTQTPH